MSSIRVLLFAILAHLIAAAPLRAEVPIVLVLGDSLSAAYGIPVESGWVSLLAKRLDGEASVINASISGETTAGGLSRLPALLTRYSPDIVAIELGANDGLRGLPMAHIRENLSQLIDLSRDADAQVLLIGIELPVNFGPRYRGELRKVYADLAQERDTGLVPFLLEDVALDPSLMLDDGLHPNAAAQPAILENAWSAFDTLVSKTDEALNVGE